MCLFYEFFVGEYLIGLVDDFELFSVVGKVNASQFVQIVVLFNQEFDVGVVFYEIGVQPVELVPVDCSVCVEGDQS